MPRSGTATSKVSIPYLMAGRNLGSFRGVEVGECIIVNHREVFAAARCLGVSRLAGCDVEHTSLQFPRIGMLRRSRRRPRNAG
jgi:hypothetical protein